jgi:hypothetical protein
VQEAATAACGLAGTGGAGWAGFPPADGPRLPVAPEWVVTAIDEDSGACTTYTRPEFPC